ncbi:MULTISPECIES: glycosyltransferase [unclassified Sphingobacterium]|uniref:glycosyltransferase n=1 Tax=unclassified Sphingobacterium TaxID=2609468 RepID=UPI00104FDF99|nr:MULTISPECIES: glycosyltransferase [unclassified Sphingobacterium]MCS3555821.1 hypothetical protein [Sphingobacterium sp. JUb21]TCR00726.1 glycosyltransferase involved in cell wall biosynthesis [Sphingobacterium sp. JUb20]
MVKRILIVGNANSQHLINLVLNAQKYALGKIEIDVFDTSYPSGLDSDNMPYNNVFYCERSFPAFIYNFPIIRGVIRKFVDFRKSIKQIDVRKYDLINIHFITEDAYFLWHYLTKIGTTIMLSPWGSDVYRFKSSKFKKLKSLYDKCSFVSAPEIQFKKDIKAIFKLEDDKFINLGFGSDVIVNISKHENVTREEAKVRLNLEGKYIITCGYNGAHLQNHSQIIQAINEIKNDINEDLLLLFPMTYSGSEEYICRIEQQLIETGISYRIMKNFLSDDDMVYLRKCSDIFIHGQPTDAFSGSVQEYLLTDTKVLNGRWTRYPDLEKHEIPYSIFNSFDELGGLILELYKKPNYKISPPLKAFIRNQGWDVKGKQWADFFSAFPINER